MYVDELPAYLQKLTSVGYKIVNVVTKDVTGTCTLLLDSPNTTLYVDRCEPITNHEVVTSTKSTETHILSIINKCKSSSKHTHVVQYTECKNINAYVTMLLQLPFSANLVAIVTETPLQLSVRQVSVQGLSKDYFAVKLEEALTAVSKQLSKAATQKILKQKDRLYKYFTHVPIHNFQAVIYEGLSIDKSVEGILASCKQYRSTSMNCQGITFIPEEETIPMSNLFGMHNLKKWCERRKDWSKLLDTPKGLLLTGVPGTGKSYACSAIANMFNLPLVKLSLPEVLDKYVGGSEANLRSALIYIEQNSPCVVQIDEVEKMFDTSDPTRATRSLLGILLSWMQDNNKGSFLVFTANDPLSLPPELTRKGRVDEIFFCGMPEVQDLLAYVKSLESNIKDDEAPIEWYGHTYADIQYIVGAMNMDDSVISIDTITQELQSTTKAYDIYQDVYAKLQQSLKGAVNA